ncbi:hypothetical protein GYA27_00735 [candidate division WWE3 bacterium]|uniref:Glycosyltransferase 2-like domain-containing protein n=1 Tax=candidate division WWE3 bacterium TaxID=2053526 RepID=A0A7X9DK85_UNCKA|nr:hypothetical protein [candidate division WWE3 bacterium]
MKRLIVLLPVAANLRITLLEEILSIIREETSRFSVDLHFLLTVNQSSLDAGNPVSKLLELQERHTDLEVFEVPAVEGAITDAGPGRYVYGFYKVSQLGDFVIDIDSAGAHDPRSIGKFLEALLSGQKAVFSTRFGMKDARDLYPFQRQLASRVATLLSNVILGVGIYYPDMASGYQGYSSDLLQRVFRVAPPESWITMSTTTAFIETELRSYVLWLLKTTGANLRSSVQVIPIIYGVNKKGVKFPASVGLKALKAFWLLYQRKPVYLQKCKDLFAEKTGKSD